jgi:hypothetical protein
MTVELYLYSEPVHNLAFYWAWVKYYCELVGVGGWGSVAFWCQVRKAMKPGMQSILC